MCFNKNTLSIALAIVFGTTSIGCGQTFRSSSKSSAAAAASVDVNQEMQKAADANAAAQQAMADSLLAIASLLDANGNVDLSKFQSSITAQIGPQGPLQPLLDKLNSVFNTLFAKIDLVKTQFTAVRAALAAATAKLDPSIPSQALMVQQIQAQLAQIDALEAKFQDNMHQLAAKLDMATSALDKLVQTATGLIPVPGLAVVAGILVDTLVLSDVKTLIASVKGKLLAV